MDNPPFNADNFCEKNKMIIDTVTPQKADFLPILYEGLLKTFP